MFDTLNLVGSGYLAIKAMHRKGQNDTAQRIDDLVAGTPVPVICIDAIANSTANIALAIGALAFAPFSGPVGLVLAAKDLYVHRAQIKAGAIAAHARVTTLLRRRSAKPVARLYILKGATS